MKVSSRERVVILVGIGAALAVLIFYAITRVVPDGQNLAREVDLKKRMLRSQRETLTREGFYKARLDQYRKQLDQDITRFLPGENASLAVADLQKIVKDIADRSGVEVIQRNPQTEKKVQDIAIKVSVRIETNCTPEQLVQFLASIQNYEKLLKVDDLVISSLRIQKRFEIRPSIAISGYIKAPEEKPKEKASVGIAVPGKTRKPELQMYGASGADFAETHTRG